MSTRNTANPFQALDASRFRKDRETPRRESLSLSQPKQAKQAVCTVAPGTLPAPVADEAALFALAMQSTAPVRRVMDKTRAATKTATAQAPEPPREENLFAAAMGDVVPIRAKGRDLPPPPPQSRQAAGGHPYAASSTEYAMADVLAGKVEFALEYTEEFIQGHVLGLDSLILGKLRAGAYSPEGHIDLHGRNMEQAYAALAAFVRYAYQDGKRHLLIITGRGRNSPGGTPVLRERVQSWLTRDPLKRVVLGFCTAKPGDGGAGALYLLLRKRKKDQGKIIWDRMPSEEELLL